MSARKLFLLAALGAVVDLSWGHGMMLDPPGRSSLWRFDNKSPVNYDDQELYCGGQGTQWEENGGKCGICGDNYKDPVPRDNENTGKYGRGKIAKEYKMGSTINVGVLLTTNHKGWFQFHVCDLKDRTKPETEECFQTVQLADGKDKYVLPNKHDGYFHVDLKLPEGLTCEQCVLRWFYWTAETWGECDDGSFADGCGPQETFWSCADIAIH